MCDHVVVATSFPCIWLPDLWLTPFLFAVLVWLSWVDLREHRLPDAGTLPLLVLGLALAFGRQGGLPWAELIGAAAGFGLFWAIGAAYFRWRGQDGLGLGDAKLLAAAGAWLGWAALPGLVLAAALLGLGAALVLGRTADRPLAFGPALALAFAGLWLSRLALGWPAAGL
jgi:prepilin signal peptidase PulO-like enzyme (type II secretory pathway)